MKKLREKNQFGISEQALLLSAQQLSVWQDQEKASHVPQYQPDEILEYLTTVPKFDLREEFEPGSSTPEELEAHLRELKYRASWLEALLYITNEELKLFAGALETTREALDSASKDAIGAE